VLGRWQHKRSSLTIYKYEKCYWIYL
jgi:hypothetical protein